MSSSRSLTGFRKNVARKMIRADYRLNDPLFGAVHRTRGNGPNARHYLELGEVGRSRLVSNRVFWVLVNAYGIVLVGSVIVRWLIRTMTRDHPAERDLPEILAIVGFLVLLLVTFSWFALKSISWIRWMVRLWNVDLRALRGRSRARSTGGAHAKGHTLSRSSARVDMRLTAGPFRFATLFDIVVVWFRSEVIRKIVKADWRPGDRTMGVPGIGQMIRWYPEEYLTSDKLGRAIMIVSTLLPMSLGLLLVYYVRPSNFVGEFSAVDYHFVAITLCLSWRILLDSQSFLRWTFRNWNTPADNSP